MNKISLATIILAFAAAFNVEAEITLPHLISDNMMLQTGVDANIFGKATPGAKITVAPSWAKQKSTAITAPDSTWLVKVATPAPGGPYTISISGDNDNVTIANVLIGEVWFCSGQSNMEMPMRGYQCQPVRGGNEEIAFARPQNKIRIFSADYPTDEYQYLHSLTPREDVVGYWRDTNPESVALTSATAYYFAKYLNSLLDIPVGIIVSSRGGAHIEAFMSRESLKDFPEVDVDRVYAPGHNIVDTDDGTVLYNGRIYPFRNYNVKGMIWYQGEGNVCNAPRYADLLEAFIRTDIRGLWRNDSMPFYEVEIAPFDGNSPDSIRSAIVREAQLEVAQRVPGVGIVSLLDAGEDRIIHPADKAIVGRRLAMLAAGDTYGQTGFLYKSPSFESMEIDGNVINIKVADAPHGLYPMYTPLDSFEVAGEDGVWHKATGEIGEIPGVWTMYFRVWSDEVPEPKHVRYAFHINPRASVFNLAGLPLHPFRTLKN